VVFYCNWISGLGFGTADIPFQFFESGLNLPSGGVILDYLGTDRVRSVEKRATHCVSGDTPTLLFHNFTFPARIFHDIDNQQNIELNIVGYSPTRS
jgi:hypothetical protein